MNDIPIKVTMKYKDKIYSYIEEFSWDYTLSSLDYWYTEHQCAHHFASKIRNNCDPNFPELGCDDEELKLISVEVVIERECR